MPMWLRGAGQMTMSPGWAWLASTRVPSPPLSAVSTDETPFVLVPIFARPAFARMLLTDQAQARLPPSGPLRVLVFM